MYRRSATTADTLQIKALTIFGNRQVSLITNTKAWLRIVWENAHLDDRTLILTESRRTVRELHEEEEEVLRKITILFRTAGVPVPSSWLRVTCPNTLTATTVILRFTERGLRLSPCALLREVS